MSSDTHSTRSGLSRTHGLAAAKPNESLIRSGGLTETTNRLLKDSIDELKHHDTQSRQSILLAHTQRRGQTDQIRRHAPNNALLSKDWRSRPAMDAGEGFPQIRTNSRYTSAPNFGIAENQKENYMSANTAADMNTGSFHRLHDQENTSFGGHLSQATYENDSDIKVGEGADGGDRASGQDSHGGSDQPKRRHNKKKLLRQKHSMKLQGLFGPAPTVSPANQSPTSTEIVNVSGNRSDTNHSGTFGLADISINAEEYPSETSSNETAKPIVQIQKVKNHRNLHQKAWGNLNDYNYIRNNAGMGSREGRGLPSHNQAEQNGLRETFSGRNSHHYSELGNHGSANSNSSDSSYAYVRSADEDCGENERYQNMLSKLQKQPTNAKTNDTAKMSSQMPCSDMTHGSAMSKPTKHVDDRVHPTLDAIPSGSMVSQKAQTLNPKAPEFSTFTQSKTKPATVQCGNPAKFSRAPVSGLFDAATLAVTTSVPNATEFRGDLTDSNHAGLIAGLITQNMILVADYIKHRQMMIGRVLTIAEFNEIMADVKRHGSGNQGAPSILIPSLSLTPTNYLAPTQHKMAPVPHHGGHGADPPRGLGSQASYMAHTGVPAVVSQPDSLPGFPARPMHGSMGHNIGTTLGGLASHNGHLFPPAPPTIRDGMYPMNESSAHRELLSNKSVGTTTSQAAHAPFMPLDPQSALSYPIIGPKPVSKPKGPPRPCDPSWNKQQQAYEAYLEHSRTINPDYHQECRDRQLRRADRQKREEHKAQFNIPAKRSAAIAIKQPGAAQT